MKIQVTKKYWKSVDDIMATAIQVVGSDKVTTIEEFLQDYNHPLIIASITFKPSPEHKNPSVFHKRSRKK